MYKRVDRKIKPVSTTFPEEARVRRTIPQDPLLTLAKLPTHPPEFQPTERLTEERMKELNVNQDNFLWPEEEKLFKHVMKLNEQTLPYEEKDRGTFSQEYFSDYVMPVVEHTPWEYKNIPIPPGIRQKVIEFLKSKMEAGVYEASQSSYRSRWFCILKKSGALRLIHDLQPLNKISIRDAGQIPEPDDFIEPYGGCQCYTMFDMFWGFDARKVDVKSRDLTAFYTPLGLLRITALPMGYTNSPAEFQNCMVFILQDEIPHVANIFIDDLPIRGPQTQYLTEDGQPSTIPENPGIRQFIWEHANDVHRIMHRVKCAGGTFSPKKTQVCRPSVIILGQRCSAEGRHPEDGRVTKILNWPVLKTSTEVRGFLGLCGTVRIWIKDYSKLARPLIDLVRKNFEFEWGDAQKEAFDVLKKQVTTAPALRAIDYKSKLPAYLSVDTSQKAVGFILSQIDENGKRRPARYGSIPLNERESRYSQPKLELYGLFRALRSWRKYIIGLENLHVEVDAKYIKGMISAPDMQPNAAMNRWIQGILLFDFTLIHIPGTKFRGPDALSRRDLGENETPPLEEYDDSWLDDMSLLAYLPDQRTVQQIDTFIQQITAGSPARVLLGCMECTKMQEDMLREIKELHEDRSLPVKVTAAAEKKFYKKASQYYVTPDGRMFKRNKEKSPLLVVLDPDIRNRILTEAHDQLGHKGEQAVYDVLRIRTFWPGMRTDVHRHVSTCHECQIRQLTRMLLPPTISAPVTIFEKVFVDVMFMHPHSKNYGYIVCAKDDLTGVVEASPLINNNSKELAKFFWEKIYCRYGAIGQVVTDNGSEVKGAFEILIRKLNIPHVRVSPYNKRAGGVVERGHFILREAIVKACPKRAKDGQIKNWHKHIDAAVFADRVTVSSVTGYSPYFLLHGVEPLLPFDLLEATFMVEGFRSGMTTSDLLALRIRQLSRHASDLAKAADALKAARLNSREQFIKRFEHRLLKSEYSPGDLVLVQNSRLEMTVNRFKTHPRYLGPYEVERRTQGGSYKLKELDGTLLRKNVAAFRLYPYISRNGPEFQKLTQESNHLTDPSQYAEETSRVEEDSESEWDQVD
ncbi:uncharacterized protein ARMOST_21023 [Armillaria ostoyae]|uniref:Integrase catalytic domain-containing protein n=1 Tax=Armillaria ostoyae TaxID=47428 RepID=A0A284S8Y9_ARMOS|nr:uncharacterized protein ARMOST_21023 [Armillaria ostoyae]